MRILEFYTGNKTYMYPNGELATPQRIQQDFPAVTVFKHCIETDEVGQVCFAVENFAALRSAYNIDSSLSDNDALLAIQEIINTNPEQEIADETRIADALEDLVVLNLPDEE